MIGYLCVKGFVKVVSRVAFRADNVIGLFRRREVEDLVFVEGVTEECGIIPVETIFAETVLAPSASRSNLSMCG